MQREIGICNRGPGLFVVGVAALLLAGCGQDDFRYGCTTDSDCTAGFVCHPALECVKDSTRPDWQLAFTYKLSSATEFTHRSVPEAQPVGSLALYARYEAAGGEQLEADRINNSAWDVTADGRWALITSWNKADVMDLRSNSFARLISPIADTTVCQNAALPLCSPGDVAGLSNNARVVVYAVQSNSGLAVMRRTDGFGPIQNSSWSLPTHIALPQMAEGLSAPDPILGYDQLSALDVSARGDRVVCECGRDTIGWAICIADTAGSTSRVLLHPKRPGDFPDTFDVAGLSRPAWTPNGDVVFAGQLASRSALWLWQGGTAQLLTPEGDWRAPCPLPNGEILAVFDAASDSQLRIHGRDTSLSFDVIADDYIYDYRCHLQSPDP